MKAIVLGDTHGNTKATIHVIKQAREHGVKKIIQLGDLGLWTHLADGVSFIDMVNEACRQEGVKIYAIGGNHENWVHWDWHIANGPKTSNGFTMLRTHIMIAPKVHGWVWEGKKMFGIGGAYSIDKSWRINTETTLKARYEAATGRDTKNYLWWPGEQLTDDDLAGVRNLKTDYLFSHDCSDRTPFTFTKQDINSKIHRQRIDEVLKRTNPEFHFHGHMHKRYEWMNRTSGDHYAQTYGLDCDGVPDNWGILDLEQDTFRYNTQLRDYGF